MPKRPPITCPDHPDQLTYLRPVDVWSCLAPGCDFDVWFSADDDSWVTSQREEQS